MDAVVIAQAVPGQQRNAETGEVTLKVIRVLRGEDLVKPGQQVQAVYYGNVEEGRRFMLTGVDPPNLQWSCLPITERSEKYLAKVNQLPDDDLARLRFYQQYFEDKDPMLARDAYDEFAIAPYESVQRLKDDMDRPQLVRWIQDPEMPADRKRLYLTMLGICGTQADVPMLEEMLRSEQQSTRGGLDALIACYLSLTGEKGLPLIDQLFLANKQSPYADTYAAIMALRFHGTEADTIPRSALTESLHQVLDRPDLADLVIPDLARWGDWSQIDRLVRLFAEADEDNNWVRVPVVNYLRACPLPEAEVALKKLEQIDPESVRRANTFFSAPIPQAAPKPESSSQYIPLVPGDQRFAAVLPAAPAALRVDRPWADARRAAFPATAAMLTSTSSATSNRTGIFSVLAMATASVMITGWLILTGGAPASP